MNRIKFFSTSILIFVFTLTSCSSDDNNPDLEETPISISTQDLSITMDENPENGQIIGTVVGSTNEGTLSFSIIEQNPSAAFEIDATSGELKVANANLFKFETNPEITGTVKVANGDVFETAMVIVSLNEIYEENIFYGSSIVLKNQSEVNSFGENNYTHIPGRLTISSNDFPHSSDINDLSPLKSIRSTGSLFVTINDLLNNLNGLHNIETIDGYLLIAFNKNLENISALNKVAKLGGETEGHLVIHMNASLIDLDGLENFTSVGGDLRILSNELLDNINSLGNLTSIGRHLEIMFNPSITNVNALSNLTNMGGNNFEITENQSLVSLSGFENLNATIENLNIFKNNALKNLNGLENLQVIRSLNINNNNLLMNLNGLVKTTSLLEDLQIQNNPALVDLNGLNNLSSVYSLTVKSNESLSNLHGLSNLISVPHNFRIKDNISLTNLCDLQNLFSNGNYCDDCFDVSGNAFNPRLQDIIEGNCSL